MPQGLLRVVPGGRAALNGDAPALTSERGSGGVRWTLTPGKSSGGLPGHFARSGGQTCVGCGRGAARCSVIGGCCGFR